MKQMWAQVWMSTNVNVVGTAVTESPRFSTFTLRQKIKVFCHHFLNWRQFEDKYFESTSPCNWINVELHLGTQVENKDLVWLWFQYSNRNCQPRGLGSEKKYLGSIFYKCPPRHFTDSPGALWRSFWGGFLLFPAWQPDLPTIAAVPFNMSW
jgi:hypothetical protein